MTTDTFRQAAENDDGSYPESWKPDVGDFLVGTIEDYSEGTTSFGTYAIAVIRDEDTGELRSVWLMHTVLEGEFKKLDPQVGERVSIKRFDNGKTASGTPYQRYRVKVAGRTLRPKFSRADDVPPQDVAAVKAESSRPFTEQEVLERTAELDAQDGQPLDQVPIALVEDGKHSTKDEQEESGDGTPF